eukprot:6172560-Pleurochrysis_carterae.AAC.2
MKNPRKTAQASTTFSAWLLSSVRATIRSRFAMRRGCRMAFSDACRTAATHAPHCAWDPGQAVAAGVRWYAPRRDRGCASLWTRSRRVGMPRRAAVRESAKMLRGV